MATQRALPPLRSEDATPHSQKWTTGHWQSLPSCLNKRSASAVSSVETAMQRKTFEHGHPNQFRLLMQGILMRAKFSGKLGDRGASRPTPQAHASADLAMRLAHSRWDSCHFEERAATKQIVAMLVVLKALELRCLSSCFQIWFFTWAIDVIEPP